VNAGKCNSISFYRGPKPVMFQNVIGDSDLERVDVGSSMTLIRTRRCMRLLSGRVWRIERIQLYTIS
jgi:hypothetical protein